MRYIFDGHNLVFAVRGSGEQFASLTVEGATHLLCHILEEYLTMKKAKGTLFYDGTGPMDKRFYNNFSHLEVEFSGKNYEADDLIEDEIISSSAPKQLIVVSSDRKIRNIATRRRAASIASMDFWTVIIKEMERPKGKVKEPKAKRSGITSSETAYWMKLFKIE